MNSKVFLGFLRTRKDVIMFGHPHILVSTRRPSTVPRPPLAAGERHERCGGEGAPMCECQPPAATVAPIAAKPGIVCTCLPSDPQQAFPVLDGLTRFAILRLSPPPPPPPPSSSTLKNTSALCAYPTPLP